MRVWRNEGEFDLESCVVTLGAFDGIHKGHQALIRRAMALARELNTACVVYTFDRHPLSVLRPEAAPKALLTPEEKIKKLEQMGVDGVLLQPFTREYASIEPMEYLRRLTDGLHAKGIVVGFNFTFGAFGRGNAALICDAAARMGYRAIIVDAVTDGAETVSSTLIRALLQAGEVDRARRLLAPEPKNEC